MPTKLTVRCTEKEYDAIKKKADKLGMSLSEYVRFVALHAEAEVNAIKEDMLTSTVSEKSKLK